MPPLCHCRPGPLAVRSPSRRPWSRLAGIGLATIELLTSTEGTQLSERYRRQEEAVDVLRYELYPQRCSESVKAEDVQIFVEVA